MNTEWTAYNDAASRAVFLRFKKALEPLMAATAPDWLLHHIEMRRDALEYGHNNRVEILLVLKPIGEARFVDPDADLEAGPKRLPSPR